MKKILVIDNYDSFAYNLVHYIAQITGVHPDVFRNDEISTDKVNEYDKILLSPGPGLPEEAGICLELIKKFSATKSILGICLGHQAIGEAFGGTLLNLTEVYHGLATPVNLKLENEPLFKGVPSTITVGRYHSWVIAKDNLPECLTVTCEDDKGTIMGISHKQYDVKGLQFHPESVLTEYGMDIMRNWVAV